MYKFLIDECLSPALAGAAQARGHLALHTNWLKLSGKKDRSIAAHAIADEWIVVTNNGVDYRSLYRAMDVHPGLIIILDSAKRNDQIRMFEAALDCLLNREEMINKLIEVTLDGVVTLSDFPPFQDNI
jgi:predicted nuclease of predicted toxin-antitoxin system